VEEVLTETHILENMNTNQQEDWDIKLKDWARLPNSYINILTKLK
jgi:hypothetical protein